MEMRTWVVDEYKDLDLDKKVYKADTMVDILTFLRRNNLTESKKKRLKLCTESGVILAVRQLISDTPAKGLACD
jgi:hypothetical protein